MSTVDVREGYKKAAVVTPHDTNAMPFQPMRGLYIGGTGAVSVRMTQGQNTVLISGLPAGTLLPIEVDRVFGTGTTATLIVALG